MDLTGVPFTEVTVSYLPSSRSGEVVKGRLAVDRRAGNAAGLHRVRRILCAVVMSQVADGRIGYIVAGTAKVNVTMELCDHP